MREVPGLFAHCYLEAIFSKAPSCKDTNRPMATGKQRSQYKPLEMTGICKENSKAKDNGIQPRDSLNLNGKVRLC